MCDCCKNQSGKRVIQKLYLHCQHKQRQTGKHTKNNIDLIKHYTQTTQQQNTDFPAQIIITLLPPNTRDGLKH